MRWFALVQAASYQSVANRFGRLLEEQAEHMNRYSKNHDGSTEPWRLSGLRSPGLVVLIVRAVCGAWIVHAVCWPGARTLERLRSGSGDVQDRCASFVKHVW